jgi:hypothetical protein
MRQHPTRKGSAESLLLLTLVPEGTGVTWHHESP